LLLKTNPNETTMEKIPKKYRNGLSVTTLRDGRGNIDSLIG